MATTIALLRRWLTINNFTMTLAFVFMVVGGFTLDGQESLAGGILLVLWFVQGQGDDIIALRREVAELRALVREGRKP